MYTNYDVEMQSRGYANTVTDTHRQRKLEADARRQRASQPAQTSRPRRPLRLVAALRLRIEQLFQVPEEGMIA